MRERKMGEDGACVERALLRTRSWLLSSLCRSVGCFLFLPWRDTDPPSASAKINLFMEEPKSNTIFPFQVPPEHWEAAALKFSS